MISWEWRIVYAAMPQFAAEYFPELSGLSSYFTSIKMSLALEIIFVQIVKYISIRPKKNIKRQRRKVALFT